MTISLNTNTLHTVKIPFSIDKVNHKCFRSIRGDSQNFSLADNSQYLVVTSSVCNINIYLLIAGSDTAHSKHILVQTSVNITARRNFHRYTQKIK